MARSVNRARSAVALVGVLCLVSVTMDAQPLDPARGTDEKHPLRTANADPGADWNDRNPGGSANPLPRIRTGAGDWDWGDLFYDGVYATKLLVKNEC